MADAFRGLTLRIGADARPLNTAIQSIKKSTGEAETQARRLAKALTFDTTNVRLMASRFDMLEDKAKLLSASASKIATSISQASSSVVVFSERSKLAGGRLSDVAARTKDVFYQTNRIRQEYNHANAQLQVIYDEVRKVVAEEKGWAQNSKELDNYMKKLKSSYGGVTDEAKKLTSEMQGYVSTAMRTKDLAAAFGLQRHETGKLLTTLRNLRIAHGEWESDLENIKRVEGYKVARQQLKAYHAEVKGVVAEQARLNAEMYRMGTNGRLASAVNEIKLMDEATEKAVASAHRAIEAYRVMPTNLEAARSKIQAIASAEATMKAKIDSIESALAKLRSDPAFEKLAASSEEAYAKAAKVENEYTQVGAKVKMVDQRIEELNAEIAAMDEKNVSKTDSEYKRLNDTVKKLENRAAELRARLNSLDDDHAAAQLVMEYRELTDQLAAARTQAAALAAQTSKLRALGSFGKSLREFGFGMYASLTPTILMAGRYAVDAVAEMDSAFRDMQKTVNGSDAQFEQLKADAIEFSRTHVTSAQQLLEIEAIGGQLGIAVDNLQAFAHTVSNLDIATNMDAEDIATNLGKMASVIGLNTEEYDRFGDSLVRLGNNLPVMESDIMNLTSRYMGMGKVVGMTAPEMLAWSAAASATGQKAEAAGSSMQRFISNMETATTKGGDTLEAWANVAGMTAEEFKTSFGKSASDTMFRFVEGLGNIQKSGGSVNQVLKDLGINNVRDKQLMEGLANQMANAEGDARILAQALMMANDAFEGRETDLRTYGKGIELAGDAAREAEKKSQGFSGELEKMKNNAIALAEELGKAATPILQDFGSLFKDLAKWISGASDEQKLFIVKVGMMLAAIGPLTVAFGTFFQSASKVLNFMKRSQGVFTSWAAKLNMSTAAIWTNSQRGLNANIKLQKALTTIGSTKGMLGIAAAATAISLIVDAIGKAIERAEDFRKATDGLKSSLDGLNASATLGNLDDSMAEYSLYGDVVDRVIKSQGQLADKIRESYSETATNAALAEHYAEAIKTAQENYDGSTKSLAALKSAVEGYNGVTGSSIKITDEAKGTLDLSTAALDRNSAAWKANARSQAAMQAYNDLYAAQIKAQAELDAAREVASEKWAEYEEAVKTGDIALIESAQAAVAQAESDVDKLEAAADSAGKALEKAGKQVDDAREDLEYAKQTADDFTIALKNAGYQTNAFSRLAQMLGTDADTLADELAGAKISAVDMAALGVESFANLYRAANGDCKKIAAVLEALNRMGIDPKDVTVDDNGTIRDVKGRVIDLDYYKISRKSVIVSADTTDFWDSINGILRSTFSTAVSVVAGFGGQKSGGISGSGVSAFARGGVFDKVLASIPMNASGAINGIVTKPTLTSIGLVGEAGAEAVFHMRNAGGAVVPLTNGRYVRPFARAVASEMPGSQKSIALTVNLDYQAGDSAQQMARDIARELETLVNMEA